jgi:hypothetical protein
MRKLNHLFILGVIDPYRHLPLLAKILVALTFSIVATAAFAGLLGTVTDIIPTATSTVTTATSTLTSSTAKPATSTVPTGEAQAAKAQILGRNSVLADTGRLNSSTDERHNSAPDGVIASSVAGNLVTANVLHATTIATDNNQVASTASLADLKIGVGSLVGGTLNIGVDFARSEALAVGNGNGSGNSVVQGLSVNGSNVPVSGAVNQVIALVGGTQLIVNEQQAIPGGIRVNALHLVAPGIADIVIASSTAGSAQ